MTALRSFAEAHKLHQRHMFALVTDGLWGGYAHVQAAREFMRSTLYRSRYAARNLLQIQTRIDPRKIQIGMHVRLGDFVAPPSRIGEYRRMANASLPIEWFDQHCRLPAKRVGDDWQLLLVSDGSQDQLAPLLAKHRCIITADIPQGDCSDALALAGADLMVCSASSYSSLAAFLSDSPYVWFAGNLYAHAEGCYSLHGDDTNSPTQMQRNRAAVQYFLNPPALSSARGTAVDADGQLPHAVLDAAVRRREARRWELDLVRGGVTPIPQQSDAQVRRLGR